MGKTIKTVNTIGRVAAFGNSVNAVNKQYKMLNKLEKMQNKTDLEMNALKGLKRSLTTKWIVGVVFTILFSWGVCVFLQGGEAKDTILGDYDVETSYVKDGYVRYGSDDSQYYIGDLGYEENTWLYICLDEESGDVVTVREMNAVNDEWGMMQNQLFRKAGIILVVAFTVLFLGLFLALGIFEKPLRKWYAQYSLEHPGWYEKL